MVGAAMAFTYCAATVPEEDESVIVKDRILCKIPLVVQAAWVVVPPLPFISKNAAGATVPIPTNPPAPVAILVTLLAIILNWFESVVPILLVPPVKFTFPEMFILPLFTKAFPFTLIA